MAPRVYPPNMFTPTNDPATGQWFHADPAAMAAHMSGGAGAAPLDPQPGDVEDAHTPSAGIGRGVREFLGLGKNGEKRVLPALFEEVFGACCLTVPAPLPPADPFFGSDASQTATRTKRHASWLSASLWAALRRSSCATSMLCMLRLGALGPPPSLASSC